MSYPLVQSVGIVVLNQVNPQQVLIVTHGKTASHYEGVKGLPSGKIDPGETAIETAVRELREETGLITQVSNLQPLSKPYRATIEQKDGIKIFDWYVFYCKKYEGELISSDETIPEWINISDLSKYHLLPNVENAIKEARKLKSSRQ